MLTYQYIHDTNILSFTYLFNKVQKYKIKIPLITTESVGQVEISHNIMTGAWVNIV